MAYTCDTYATLRPCMHACTYKQQKHLSDSCMTHSHHLLSLSHTHTGHAGGHASPHRAPRPSCAHTRCMLTHTRHETCLPSLDHVPMLHHAGGHAAHAHTHMHACMPTHMQHAHTNETLIQAAMAMMCMQEAMSRLPTQRHAHSTRTHIHTCGIFATF